MSLSIIVARARNGVIGKDNRLIWHLSDDLKRFKTLTMGHPIVMGRKTFEPAQGPARPCPLCADRKSGLQSAGGRPSLLRCQGAACGAALRRELRDRRRAYVPRAPALCRYDVHHRDRGRFRRRCVLPGFRSFLLEAGREHRGGGKAPASLLYLSESD